MRGVNFLEIQAQAASPRVDIGIVLFNILRT